MHSLRRRLLITIALATVSILVVCGVLVFLAVRASLLADLDDTLSNEARALASLVETDGVKVKMEVDPSQLVEFRRNKRPEYFELWAEDGAVVARSPSLRQNDLPLRPRPDGRMLHQSLRFADGRAGRAVAFTFKANREDENHSAPASALAPLATLALARDTQDLTRTLLRLGIVIASVCGVAMIVAVMLMSGITYAALRPLGTLAARIASLGQADLSDRVQLREAPQELAPVVHRLNELLSRVEAAVMRERSFTADVAHELRTPLAGLETALEVCASRPREPAAYEDMARKCLRTTRSMRGMVETLLTLARADARQLHVLPEPLDLASLIRDCWAEFQERAAEQQLHVDWKLDDGCTVNTDRELIKRVILNLFDNAVTYTDPGGRVSVHAGRGDDGAGAIEICNSGCRISQANAAMVFERFWRSDEARTGSGAHCGLGLSLCRKIIDVLGGSIAVDVREQNFRIRVQLRA